MKRPFRETYDRKNRGENSLYESEGVSVNRKTDKGEVKWQL